MGADMILYEAVYPADPNWKPDWEAGKALIKKLSEEDEGFICEYNFDSPEEAYESFIGKLEEVKSAFTNGRRDMERLRVGPYRIMISGGMSWGDTPTDFADILGDLERFSILDACGFNQADHRDFKKYFFLLLERCGSEVLPLMLSHDPDLDEIIKEKLKGE